VSSNKKRTFSRPWANPWGQIDVERMDRSARRRYLERRLMEVEMLIDTVLRQHQASMSAFTLWDIASPDSDLWEDAMDLSYLEASRHAILETLADLNRPT
jgi:hypothetical protein